MKLLNEIKRETKEWKVFEGRNIRKIRNKIYILFPRGNKFYNAKRARDPRRVYFVEESGENQRRGRQETRYSPDSSNGCLASTVTL